MKDLPLVYKYHDDYITEGKYFVYEVNIYQESPKQCNILSTRFYISNKELEINERQYIKVFKNFSIVRYITLLEAPDWFVKELPIYIKHKRKYKKNERKSTISH